MDAWRRAAKVEETAKSKAKVRTGSWSADNNKRPRLEQREQLKRLTETQT